MKKQKRMKSKDLDDIAKAYTDRLFKRLPRQLRIRICAYIVHKATIMNRYDSQIMQNAMRRIDREWWYGKRKGG